MYSANRFPVMLYEGGPVGYAEGGLHDEALAVRKAGRNGDGRLVHINDEEFADMVAQYGEPTINPETGMPEFFLGKLGKILKTIAPIAVSFIPGIGPVAGAALGAGMGALNGGGIKGALLGAATGALGAGGAGGIGGKLGSNIGGKILGQTASAAAKNALGQAVIQGGLGTIGGRDPLSSALGGAMQGYLQTPKTPSVPTPSDIPTAAPSKNFVMKPDALTSGSTTDYVNNLIYGANAPATQAAINTAASGAPIAATAATGAQPNFWNRDVGFLGKLGTDLGIKNKHAILAGGLLAAGAADAMKPKEAAVDETAAREKFFGPSFSATSPGSFRLASLSGSPAAESIMSDYGKRYFNGFAYGGDVDSFAVKGPGTGRSDEIPAMLSDGEYVIDAETVALLGDGSSKAGAKKLDDLRVKIRKHKGKKLAKGKFSHDAKPADKYMAGGRI